MASAIIHLAVAKNVNKTLKRNDNMIDLGAIAPDMAKLIGVKRSVTHFISDDSESSPDVDVFYDKYKNYLNNDFEMGYYIHLLTDKLWFDEFLPNFVLDNCTIMDKSGNEIKLNGIDCEDIIYNDFDNLNSKVINYYNLDLKIFEKNFTYPTNNIQELPDKFDELLDGFNKIIKKNNNDNLIFDIDKITHFVEYCTVYILDILKEKDLI